MMSKIVKNLNETEMPKVLYKYRDWKDKWHKTILTDSEVYLASPELFKDKLDCKIPIRYDLLTDEEIFNKFYKSSIEQHRHFTIQQHQQYATRWVIDKTLIQRIEKGWFEKFNKNFGVLSLTANPKILKMWEKYSDNHTGFCVGFDSKKLLGDFERFGGGGKVNYYPELPIIHPNEDSIDKAIKNIYHKLTEWDFEEEYRTHKLNSNPIDENWRKVKVDATIFKEIIIGSKTEKNERELIISICKEKYPNAEILQASFEGEELEFKPI